MKVVRRADCCKKRVIDPRDYLFEDLAKQKCMKPNVPRIYSLKDKFPPVYDQGQSGACTACAAVGCDDYYYHAPKKKGWIPSWKYTYYNTKMLDDDLQADDGTCIDFALKSVRKLGACNSKVWSNDEPWNKRPSEAAYRDGLKGHEITTFHRMKNLNQLKQAISNGYPVPASLAWAFKSYDDNFILNTPTKKEINNAGGHAVVVVGYDDDRQLVEIRNSWGDWWGNNGYAYITYDVFKIIVDWGDTYAVVR